jgi:hypothetical protein
MHDDNFNDAVLALDAKYFGRDSNSGSSGGGSTSSNSKKEVDNGAGVGSSSPSLSSSPLLSSSPSLGNEAQAVVAEGPKDLGTTKSDGAATESKKEDEPRQEETEAKEKEKAQEKQ